MRAWHWLGTVLAGLALLLVLADAPGGGGRPSGEAEAVLLLSHGYHSSVVLPRARLAEIAATENLPALAALTGRFAGHDWLEIGWGDENFYRNVAQLELATVPHALRALFLPGNTAVLHVVGFSVSPEVAFPQGDFLRVMLPAGGLARMALGIDATASRAADGDLVDLGAGLYGPSRFFRAGGTFSILQVCNHWVAGLVRSSGLRNNRLLALLPAGLFLDLRWRAGATRWPPG
ncbi:MAG: DUF2459 domain-containing protein [Methylobacterium sp.]|nr:DUF2459 domain-containing protein [Methylobacterium sp.]MCA3604820.1 DUF2459 domain-containing protein [Methylobacterium sp.]MCA3616372.1 DUF2459 domain-containing protein [Methylobacterium sp.]MCA4909855.1 DUF2459 domain-containing protein [Methylobacterium sp.]